MKKASSHGQVFNYIHFFQSPHSHCQSYRKSTLIFIGRTDAEAEAPILWPLDVKSQLIGKDPDARKD